LQKFVCIVSNKLKLKAVQ